MVKSRKKTWVGILSCLFLTTVTQAQLLVDLETGVVFNTKYNEVRIPGNTGTLFDLAEGFNSDPTWFYRIRLGYTINKRHTISALFAPLTIQYTGNPSFPINYQGTTFNPGINLTTDYKFNSYRLTYRYNFIRQDKFTLGAGVTAKIRDASIRLKNEVKEAEKTNLGIVPLINFYTAWNFACRWQLIVEGDALVAPQGRAEDIFAGLGYKLLEDKVILKAGYRVLEGGADNEEVYNFTWIDYASVGVILNL